MAISSTPKQQHICQKCGATLSRFSHLQRHLLRHADESEAGYHCQICDKRFQRKDVYQRHQRGVHGPGQHQRTTRKKSCQRCMRYRLKCSRELPCAACHNKDVACKYESTIHPNSVSSSTDWRPSQNREECESQHSTTDLNASERPPLTETDWQIPPGTITGDDLQASPPIGSEYETFSGSITHINVSQSRAPEYLVEDDPTTSLPDDFDINDLGFFDSSTFRASRADWFVCDTEFSDHQTMVSEVEADTCMVSGLVLGTVPQTPNLRSRARSPSGNEAFPALHGPPRSATQGQEHGQEHGQDYEQEGLVENVSERPPSLEKLCQKHTDCQTSYPAAGDRESEETWPAVLDRGGNEMWPFDYASNKGFRIIKLPPLRQVLEDTVGRRPAIEKATMLDLIKILSTPHIPSMNEEPILEALPAVVFLTKLIKIYFAEFHAVFPIIHLPTWKIETCPTPLLAAMACLGANYSTAEGSPEVAALLAEITQRALFWTGQTDTTAFRNTGYIAAMCFHHLYSLGLGNRRLYELAEASRSTMLASLRGMGVLSGDEYSDCTLRSVSSHVKHLDAAGLEDAWQQWRDNEARIRTAWTVFEFDCTIATMTGKRGVFSLNELPSRLPCTESLWEAPSAKTWASMLAFSSQCEGFYTAFQSLMTSSSVPHATSAWSKRLLAQALGRLHTDLKELQDTSRQSLLGLASLAESQKASRGTILAGLSALHDSLSNPTSTAEVVSMNIACLGSHYTHLVDDNQAMDLVIFLFRNSGRELSASLSNELARARQHLRAIFTHYPAETRRAASHAVLVTAIARECPIFTPCETMRVFNSFAFLLAFTKLSSSEAHNEGPLIHLDVLPWQRSEQDGLDLERWIQQGGHASIANIDLCDPQNFEPLREIALDAMHDLHVWGLARKFYKILRSFA